MSKDFMILPYVIWIFLSQWTTKKASKNPRRISQVLLTGGSM